MNANDIWVDFGDNINTSNTFKEKPITSYVIKHLCMMS